MPARANPRIRITGGQWRSRVLPVTTHPGLRPTLAQHRERLFNWLQFNCAGARVLDAYAGTGILGLEALSRGAASAVFLERDATVAKVLRQQIEALGASAEVFTTDALSWVAQSTQPFDLILLDPPFAPKALQDSLTVVLHSRCVQPGTLIYAEQAVPSEPLSAPGCELWKHSIKGRIEQLLWRYVG
jgi:16S rRNA (guanine966-N2)-methyltransferase